MPPTRISVVALPMKIDLTLGEVRRLAFRKLEYAHAAIPFIVS